MHKTVVREATLNDVDALWRVEQHCFAPNRRSDPRAIRHGILSPNQHVFVLERIENAGESTIVGSATLFVYKHTLRIYSLAVLEAWRGQGLGESLIRHVSRLAANEGFSRITLEADADDKRLIDWYQKRAFGVTRHLPDYYGPGEAAYRMERQVAEPRAADAVSGNLIVVNNASKWTLATPNAEIVSAKDYLTGEHYRNAEHFSVLNLCNSYKTHSIGYYISLLAGARNHRVIPSVMTMKDVANLSIAQSLLDEITDFLQLKLKSEGKTTLEIPVLLGKTPKTKYSSLAGKLFSLFEIPFFKILLVHTGAWEVKKITLLDLTTVLNTYPALAGDAITGFLQRKRFRRTPLKKYKYDMAILVNSEEKTQPSCPIALSNFKAAAEQLGFQVEFIGKIDYRRIPEFDALFIRETTSVDNHTYRFARYAYTEGLVVIDDPWSIMRCSNKIYLQERLARCRVPQPRAWLLTRGALHEKWVHALTYPLVLKLPESSFSLGVHRVNDRAELLARVETMFQKSDLLIAQEFLTSAFDWRIGLLDNKPLFACKYFMANGHWQIYNWAANDAADASNFVGAVESVPINRVPTHVLKTAVKASSLIGDGLYGVDLKDVGGQAVVIEVNDNPNIDADLEDAILKEALYTRVMQTFMHRIEHERRAPTFTYSK